MQQAPATSPQTTIPTTAPTTALGQALAAIIAILIAALADHARQHPSLAGLIRLTIARLEATVTEFDALVAAHQSPGSTMPSSRRRTRFGATTPRLRQEQFHMETERRRVAAAPLRLSVSMWNPYAFPRAPP